MFETKNQYDYDVSGTKRTLPPALSVSKQYILEQKKRVNHCMVVSLNRRHHSLSTLNPMSNNAYINRRLTRQGHTCPLKAILNSYLNFPYIGDLPL